MATEAQRKAQRRYDARNTRQVHIKLNLRVLPAYAGMIPGSLVCLSFLGKCSPRMRG